MNENSENREAHGRRAAAGYVAANLNVRNAPDSKRVMMSAGLAERFAAEFPEREGRNDGVVYGDDTLGSAYTKGGV